MFRKWIGGLLTGLLLGSLLVAFPEAQNYVWTSINGVPYSPSATIGGSLTIGAGGAIDMGNAAAIRTGTTAGDTLLLQAYDTDTGPAYVSPITLTAGTSPTLGIWAGSAGAPAIVNQASATKQGGIYFVNDSVIISGSQSAAASFNYNAFAEFGVASGGKIGFGASTPFALDTFFMREAAATLQLGTDAAGTTAYTLKSNDRITSDGVGGDLTIAAGRGRGGLGGYVYIDVAPALAATTPGVLQHAIIVDPTASAVTLGTTAGTGLGSLYAGAYFAGTTAGIDKTCGGPVVSATFIKGIMTAMTCTSEPQPDPLTQTEVNELRGLLNANRTKQ